jgi:hypothetical protein
MLEIISMGFNIRISYCSNLLNLSDTAKKKWECNETVREPCIDFKKAYDSVRRELFYNILIEFGIPMTLAGPVKMCLN